MTDDRLERWQQGHPPEFPKSLAQRVTERARAARTVRVDVTAALLGDPEPGRSALDRR